MIEFIITINKSGVETLHCKQKDIPEIIEDIIYLNTTEVYDNDN